MWRRIMNKKTMGKILNKYYTPFIRKEVAEMKRNAKQLAKKLEKDPDNIELAIRLCLNPFNTTVECDFLGSVGILNEILEEID